jgi:bifunctional DNA-binding transcriptional regulator/antitoxin component of YhaV-PrlF toxin-antitoxin module
MTHLSPDQECPMPQADSHAGSTYRLALDDRGRLVLPARLRREAHLEPGGRVIVTPDPEGAGVRVEAAADYALRLQGAFSPATGSLVDELLAERRAEAEGEH